MFINPRYEHNENFTLQRPFELPGLYDKPVSAPAGLFLAVDNLY